jgi:predicted acyl esterase
MSGLQGMDITAGLGAVFRPGCSPESRGYIAPRQETSEIDGVLFERDVPVELRDGKKLYVDVFRPVGRTGLPAIIEYAPFGKSRKTDWSVFRNAEVPVDRIWPGTPFENHDPIEWAKDGFVLIHADGRGNWNSEGQATFFSPEEAESGYDLVEWAAAQAWSSGRIGWGGCSYFGMTAWSVASLQPPHLACIMPWEAASDVYREAYFHAGIPVAPFTHAWMQMTSVSRTEVEDMEVAQRTHPLFDDYWKSKVADWSKVEVPAFVATGWPAQGIHVRGTIEAYLGISSPQKWLYLHAGKEWAAFYDPRNVALQKAFYARFLRGDNNEVTDWPKVRLVVRTAGKAGFERAEEAWPIQRTEHTAFFLDAAAASLSQCTPAMEATVAYDSLKKGDRAQFDIRFEEATELTGYAKVRLWVSAHESNDADLFVGFQKLDREGNVVSFPYFGQFDDGQAAYGFIRVSHRELDEERSRPERPYLKHERLLFLQNEEPVAVDIEMWPSSTHFDAGQGLRVIVQGTDLNAYEGEGLHYANHYPLHNYGRHVIYTGGKYDSHVLLPVVPRQEGARS